MLTILEYIDLNNWILLNCHSLSKYLCQFGLYNKISQTRWLKQMTFILTVLKVGEDQGCGRFSSWWVLFLTCKQLPSGCTFTWQRDEVLISLPFLIWTLIPSWGFTFITLFKTSISLSPHLLIYHIKGTPSG